MLDGGFFSPILIMKTLFSPCCCFLKKNMVYLGERGETDFSEKNQEIRVLTAGIYQCGGSFLQLSNFCSENVTQTQALINLANKEPLPKQIPAVNMQSVLWLKQESTLCLNLIYMHICLFGCSTVFEQVQFCSQCRS